MMSNTNNKLTLCSEEELAEIKALVGEPSIGTTDIVTDIHNGRFVRANIAEDCEDVSPTINFTSEQVYGVSDLEYVEMVNRASAEQPCTGIYGLIRYAVLDKVILEDRLEYLTTAYREGFDVVGRVCLPDIVSMEFMENLMEKVKNKIKSINKKIERYKKLNDLIQDCDDIVQK